MHLREQIIFKSTYILTAVPWSPLYVGLKFQLNIIMQPQPNYQRGLLGSGLLGRRHQKLKTEFNVCWQADKEVRLLWQGA